MGPADPALVDDEAGSKHLPSRVQVETWDDGEAVRFLVVAQNAAEAVAWLAVHDKSTKILFTGVSLVERCPSHHDRDAIARDMFVAPATMFDLLDLEMLGTEASRLPQFIDEVFNEARGTRKVPWRERALGGLPNADVFRLSRMDVHLGVCWTARGYGQAVGFYRPTTMRLFDCPPDGVITAPGKGEPPRGAVITFREVGDGKLVRRAFVKGVATLAADHCWEATGLLGITSWTLEAYAFFAEPGERGDRRRQAGALYPGFAPVIASVAAVAEAVDAGRPFERALRDRVASLPPMGRGERLTLAALRRLRVLPARIEYHDLVRAIDLASRLPLDWLPGEGGWWRNFLDETAGLVDMGDRLGLDVADLLAGHGLERGEERRRPGPGEEGTLRLAEDMAKHFVRTLLTPVHGFLGIPPARHDDVAVAEAGRILFGGKSVAGIDALQKAWHRDFDTLAAALPLRKGAKEWPALFAPYVAGNGLVLECLTSEAALKAEGSRGLDADGVRGLGHCVGSYAETAYTGAVHIVSVRKRIGPRLARLSTVEVRTDEGEHGCVHLEVLQHSGRGNDQPPEDARTAVMDLVRALGSGTHPHAPEALARRDVAAFSAGYDWREPGMLAQAFAAWRRHLPRGTARGGVEALVRRIAEGRGVAVDWEALAALTDRRVSA